MLSRFRSDDDFLPVSPSWALWAECAECAECCRVFLSLGLVCIQGLPLGTGKAERQGTARAAVIVSFLLNNNGEEDEIKQVNKKE